MSTRIAVCLSALGLLAVAGGMAHGQLVIKDKPVWTMEYLNVQRGKFGPALGYLDDNWMRVREEAKRQGAVLTYLRIADEAKSGNELENNRTIVLLTEFRNQAAYDGHEKLFASILKQLQESTPDVINSFQHEDLYQIVSTRVFEDYTEHSSAKFKLLAQR